MNHERMQQLPSRKMATDHTTQGPVTIATRYIPPRQQYINSIKLNKIYNNDEPIYLIGDLNAYHRTFSYRNNLRVQQIVTLIDTDKCRHIGPFFDTRVTANTRRKPDIALTNNRAYLNTHLRQENTDNTIQSAPWSTAQQTY